MTGPNGNPQRLTAAEDRARGDAARARQRARRKPQHPSRNTKPRANPDVDPAALAVGVEKLRSVIAK